MRDQQQAIRAALRIARAGKDIGGGLSSIGSFNALGPGDVLETIGAGSAANRLPPNVHAGATNPTALRSPGVVKIPPLPKPGDPVGVIAPLPPGSSPTTPAMGSGEGVNGADDHGMEGLAFGNNDAVGRGIQSALGMMGVHGGFDGGASAAIGKGNADSHSADAQQAENNSGTYDGGYGGADSGGGGPGQGSSDGPGGWGMGMGGDDGGGGTGGFGGYANGGYIPLHRASGGAVDPVVLKALHVIATDLAHLAHDHGIPPHELAGRIARIFLPRRS